MLMGRLLWAALLCSLSCLHAFKPDDFKKCSDASFCRRQRATAEGSAKFTVGAFSQSGLRVVADLQDEEQPGKPLVLDVTAYSNGVFRVKILEKNPIRPRHEVRDALVDDLHRLETEAHIQDLGHEVVITTHADATRRLRIVKAPFQAVLDFDGTPSVFLNQRGLLRYERQLNSEGEAPPAREGEDRNGFWGEGFKGTQDSKPRGPASIGMDVSFGGAQHVYGLPERATSLSLKNTRGPGAPDDRNPYRLYNLDVFEYELTDNYMYQPLYGAVPFLQAMDEAKTTAVLWLNSAETFIDISDHDAVQGKSSHWASESGVVDVFIMSSADPKDVSVQYTDLTGTSHMPPLFATAYHQCRWNYKDAQDVQNVDAGFDEHDIPYDVLWLDIEHTDGKKYFTWNKALFPNPAEMINALNSKGRKMVTIVDPHIKVDSSYHVYQDGSNQGFFVKKADGSEFQGHCWPGNSGYLDFVDPTVRTYWAGKFSAEQYEGFGTNALYTWNDMNEPSVFSGPEITMPKDNLHFGGVEHRDIHNQYGFYMTKATREGHIRARPEKRPFILSRSFFAGSQRDVAVWTGDNMAKWEHLAAAQPMLLTLQLSGIVFSGADVGGFFYNPEPELLVRWYQAAAYHPFFRGHAHIDTKRREPWLFGAENTALMRQAIRARYAVLPYVYTLFYEAHSKGVPVMRPLFMEYPKDTATYAMEDQFLLGAALLVKPVVHQFSSTIKVYLPGTQPWYDDETGAKTGANGWIEVATPIHKTPVFQRGGTIVPKRLRPRRSAALMRHDPYTLVVALDSAGRASGSLYVDDGDGYAFQTGHYVHRTLEFNQNTSRRARRTRALSTRTRRSSASRYSAGSRIRRRSVRTHVSSRGCTTSASSASRSASQRRRLRTTGRSRSSKPLPTNKLTAPNKENYAIR